MTGAARPKIFISIKCLWVVDIIHRLALNEMAEKGKP